jgi:ribosome-binding protein aMBF1 (putative translation factor)
VAQSEGNMHSRLVRLGNATRQQDAAAADTQEARNAAMYEARHELGWSLGEIAAAVQYDASTVQRGIAKEAARRQLIETGSQAT